MGQSSVAHVGLRERVVRGGVAIVFRQLFSLPVNAVGIVCVSRFLVPTDFGVQAVLGPAVVLAFMLVDLGTSQALVRAPDSLPLDLLRRTSRLKIAAAALTVSLLALLSPFLASTFSLPPELKVLFPAAGLLGFIQSQRNFQSVALQRRVDWQILARVEMVEIIAYNVALVFSAWLLRNAWAFVIALAVRYLVGTGILFWVSGPADAKPNCSGSMAGLLRFGIPLQASLLVSMAMNVLNPFLVGHALGTNAVGLVNWSSYLVSIPLLPLQAAPAYMFAILAERKRQNRDDSAALVSFTYIGTLVVAVTAFVVISLLPELIRAFFGTRWLGARQISEILMLGNVIYFPTLVLTALTTSAGFSMAAFYVDMAGCALLWGCAAIGMFWLGLPGYAIGIVAAGVIRFAIQSIVARRLVRSTLDCKDGFRLLLLVTGSTVAAALLGAKFAAAVGCPPRLAQIGLAYALFCLGLLVLEQGRFRREFRFCRLNFWPQRTLPADAGAAPS